MTFDGVNDYIQLGNSNLLPDSAITISTWFKSLGVNDVDDIFVSDVSWSTYTIRMGPQGEKLEVHILINFQYLHH